MYITCTFFCLADMMMSTFSSLKPFSQIKVLWAVSRRYAAAMFDFTPLFILFTLRHVVSGLPARFFFLSTGLSLPEFQVASWCAVSSDLKFLDARNLTCLQPLPNGLYTNHTSLSDHSFRLTSEEK